MDRSTKEPFDYVAAMASLRVAVKAYPKAAMFELADEGFNSVFEQLISCIISIRTFEEVTLATSRNLFATARTPAEVAALSVDQIDNLIHACTFHQPKAAQIRAIAQEAVKTHNGELPADRQTLIGFSGVGPKCANLAIGVSTGRPFGIPVDVHVHRVANRWGVVAAKSPEKTMTQLEAVLPKKYWLEINRLLVPFGRNICRSVRPKCPTCPLLSMCQQVGVTSVDPKPPPKRKTRTAE